MQSFRVAIVDPDELRRCGLIHMMSSDSRWRAMNYTGDLSSFEAYLKEQPVSIVIIDDSAAPTLDLCAILERWLTVCPSMHMVILSQNLSTRHIQRLFACGVLGYIHRPDCTRETLLACLSSVSRHQAYISPRASAELYRRDAIASEFGLRKMDMDVLKCLQQGLNTQEIAIHLQLDERSIYRSRQRLRKALDVRTNEQLIPAAMRNGLLDHGI